MCCRWVVATQRREIGRVLCLLCAQGGGRSRPSERKAPATWAGQQPGFCKNTVYRKHRFWLLHSTPWACEKTPATPYRLHPQGRRAHVVAPPPNFSVPRSAQRAARTIQRTPNGELTLPCRTSTGNTSHKRSTRPSASGLARSRQVNAPLSATHVCVHRAHQAGHGD